MMKKQILVPLLFCLALAGCDSQDHKKQTTFQVVTAKQQSVVKHLYFSGTIQPIKTVSILSPIEGRIEKLNFVYGQNVRQGQLLAIVNSLKLMDDFRQAVGSYLSKKTAYLNQIQSFDGTKVLYKAGVIDQENYKTAQSQYENSVLDFFQQEYQLKKVLLKADVNPEIIEKLNITDVSEIKKLYAKEFNHIRIIAPTSGVALFPLPTDNQGDGGSSDSSDDTGSGQITVGSKIREGQLVLSIGNLSGFSIDMTVNEVSINGLHKGMKAVVMGNAFPGKQLTGYVSYVASQAQPQTSGGGSNASVFKVIVTVPNVKQSDLRTIHVGMSAKVDIPVRQTPKILLPINAVSKKNGNSYVTVLSNGQKKEVPIVTGATTQNDVSVISGISAGQKVIVKK